MVPRAPKPAAADDGPREVCITDDRYSSSLAPPRAAVQNGTGLARFLLELDTDCRLVDLNGCNSRLGPSWLQIAELVTRRSDRVDHETAL
jgi:hypothetical protein